MKRTVKRWVKRGGMEKIIETIGYESPMENPCGNLKCCESVTLSWDDGKPEGKGCPCERASWCCRTETRSSSECCVHHKHVGNDAKVIFGTLPCLACAPAEKPKVRERVVEGFASPDEPICGMATLALKQSLTYPHPARLIIFEPVKEPTLIEACESLLSGVMPAMHHVHLYEGLREAIKRERARIEKEGKA